MLCGPAEHTSGRQGGGEVPYRTAQMAAARAWLPRRSRRPRCGRWSPRSTDSRAPGAASQKLRKSDRRYMPQQHRDRVAQRSLLGSRMQETFNGMHPGQWKQTPTTTNPPEHNPVHSAQVSALPSYQLHPWDPCCTSLKSGCDCLLSDLVEYRASPDERSWHRAALCHDAA